MRTRMRRVGGLLLILLSASASADFVVDTVNDEDTSNAACSLREAITAINTHANYNGCTSVSPDVEQSVSFALPSETLTLNGALPPITAPIFIDGTSQGPAVCTPVPNVHVKITGSGGTGIDFETGSDGSIIQGIGVSGFTDGILIFANNVTVGCVVSQNNTGGGVQVRGSDAVIGVANATTWRPNLISGNGFANVWLPLGADNTVISGNYIGVDASGLTALDSGYGIYIGGGITGVRIGLHTDDGSAARQRNVIGVHAGSGVVADIFVLGDVGSPGTELEFAL